MKLLILTKRTEIELCYWTMLWGKNKIDVKATVLFLWLLKRKAQARVVCALIINIRYVEYEIHLRTPSCKHLCLIFLSGCQEEMQSRPALIFIENHFEMFQRYTVFLILDQPEKNTRISVSLWRHKWVNDVPSSFFYSVSTTKVQIFSLKFVTLSGGWQQLLPSSQYLVTSTFLCKRERFYFAFHERLLFQNYVWNYTANFTL